MEKKYLNWNIIEAAIERLALDIQRSGISFKHIGGMPRGGLIPAVMLSHKMNIPFISSANFLKSPGNILIVDDICDSGKTLKQFQFEENIYTAVIHYKKSAIYKPNFYWDYANEDKWIVYPWERKDSKTIPDYATKGK